MKKTAIVGAFFWSVLFWFLIGYAMFSLIGCAHKEPWWVDRYNPQQKIDLTLVPDIIP